MSFGFYIPLTDSSKSDIHIGRLVLDAPAGKHGFLKAAGDKLVFEDGKEFRIWGTNLAFNGALQTKANVDKIVAHFAKYGYNTVRIISMDKRVATSLGGVIASGNTVALDPTEIDKLDYLIYKLKLKGIYVALVLHANFKYDMSDVPENSQMISNGKYVHYFEPKCEGYLKQFIANYMNHVNPYTGLAYKNDPAIIMAELLNEDGLLQGFMGGNLNGIAGQNISAYYRTLLDTLYNDWLSKRYADDAAIMGVNGWNYKAPGSNLIVNPNGENSFTGWFLSTSPGCTSSRVWDTGESAIKVTNSAILGTPHKYDIQFGQYDTPLQYKIRYEISFKVKASVPGSIQLACEYRSQTNGSWGDFGLSTAAQNISVTTDYTTCKYVFNCKETYTPGNMKLAFYLGTILGDVYIKDFIVRTAELKALDAGESLATKSIKRNNLWYEGNDFTPERSADTALFYFELEHGLNQRLYDYCKNTLGVKQLIECNNWYNGGNLSLYSQAKVADYTDMHYYFDHPTSFDISNFTQKQKSPIGDMTQNVANKVCLQAVKNKPLIFSEADDTFPVIDEYEFVPCLTAYAAFQGARGIIDYAYLQGKVESLTTRHMSEFMININSPLKHIQSVIHGLAFIKGYIKESQKEVVVNYTKDHSVATYKEFYDRPHANLGTDLKFNDIPYSLYATHKVRKTFNDNLPQAQFTDILPSEMATLQASTVYTSDTGELEWDQTDPLTSYLKVNAPKFQSITGKIANRELSTDNLTINVDKRSSITLVSLDDKNLSTSGKILLTLLADQFNNGQVKNDTNGNLTTVGTYPVMLPKISGTITITVDDSTKYKVFALDAKGRRSYKIPVTKTDTTISFTANYYSPWFIIIKDKG